MNLFSYDFMIRALLGALLVGVAAPAVGIYLVQRRMSLIGDGIGHIALTGVALGFLLRTSPVLVAVVVASLGAIAIELIRVRGRTSGDVALALMFYGGIAGGVVLIKLAAGKSNTTLVEYLFGSVLTTTQSDLAVMAALTAAILAVTVLLRPWLFATSHDEEYARVSGLPVQQLNLLMAVTAAVTVTVAMRVVGLLLVSALMVVPVATAQQMAHSFAGTMLGAVVIGVVAALAGTVGSFYVDSQSGATIVILALALFGVTSAVQAAHRRLRGGGARTSAAQPEPEPTAKDLVLEP